MKSRFNGTRTTLNGAESAHRTPTWMMAFASTVAARGQTTARGGKAAEKNWTTEEKFPSRRVKSDRDDSFTDGKYGRVLLKNMFSPLLEN